MKYLGRILATIVILFVLFVAATTTYHREPRKLVCGMAVVRMVAPERFAHHAETICKIIKSDNPAIVGKIVIVDFDLIGAPGDTVLLCSCGDASATRWSRDGEYNIPW